MRRVFLATAAVVGAAMLVGLSGALAAGGKKHRFTQTDVGAQISGGGTSGQDAIKVTDSLDGSGAGVQTFKVVGTTFPVKGSDTTVVYFADGLSKTKDTFTLTAPDANGISALTGKGSCTGGTRVHKGEKCSYTFSGTYNTKTSVYKVVSRGTSVR